MAAITIVQLLDEGTRLQPEVHSGHLSDERIKEVARRLLNSTAIELIAEHPITYQDSSRKICRLVQIYHTDSI